MGMIGKLLRKNMSAGRMAGFALSNFIGLLIVAGAVMFYVDSRSIWGMRTVSCIPTIWSSTRR